MPDTLVAAMTSVNAANATISLAPIVHLDVFIKTRLIGKISAMRVRAGTPKK